MTQRKKNMNKNLFFHAHHFVENEMVKLRDRERAAV